MEHGDHLLDIETHVSELRLDSTFYFMEANSEFFWMHILVSLIVFSTNASCILFYNLVIVLVITIET